MRAVRVSKRREKRAVFFFSTATSITPTHALLLLSSHVFCEPCLRAALSKNKKCPNCRKAMQPRQVHRVFV